METASTIPSSEAFISLAAIETDSWRRIERGSLSFKDEFHQPVTATTGSDGPSQRTVVLRKVWPMQRQVAFHTDIRSGKIRELKKHATISWHFYHQKDRIQIQLNGSATVHTTDDIADTAWYDTSLSNRKSYLAAVAPGTYWEEATSGLPAAMEERQLLPEESESGRKNFAVIVTTVTKLEWLWLNNKAHRRALFLYNGGLSRSYWLVP